MARIRYWKRRVQNCQIRARRMRRKRNGGKGMEKAYEKSWTEKGEGGGSKEKSQRERDIAYSPALSLLQLSLSILLAFPSFLSHSRFRPSFFSSSPRCLGHFAFLRRLRSSFVRPSLPLAPECDAFARSSFGPRFPRNCIPVSLLSRIVALLLPLSLSLATSLSPLSLLLTLSRSRAPFIPCAHGRSLPLAERSTTSLSVPRLPRFHHSHISTRYELAVRRRLLNGSDWSP